MTSQASFVSVYIIFISQTLIFMPSFNVLVLTRSSTDTLNSVVLTVDWHAPTVCVTISHHVSVASLEATLFKTDMGRMCVSFVLLRDHNCWWHHVVTLWHSDIIVVPQLYLQELNKQREMLYTLELVCPSTLMMHSIKPECLQFCLTYSIS